MKANGMLRIIPVYGSSELLPPSDMPVSRII